MSESAKNETAATSAPGHVKRPVREGYGGPAAPVGSAPPPVAEKSVSAVPPKKT